MDNENDSTVPVKDNWYCLKCINYQLPFGILNDKQLYVNSKGITTESSLDNIKFSLDKADKNVAKQICNLIIENTDPSNTDTNFCKYYETDNFAKSKFNSQSNLSILHLNIASLQFHFESLLILLDILEFPFDSIAITETKIKSNVHPTKDINIPNYHYYSTPSEASKGGTLIYVSDNLVSKPRKDLEIYKPKQLESTFIEIVVPRGKNIIIGCVYRHHGIELNEFNELFTPILDKTNKEKKLACIAGDYNIDLLKINKIKQIEDYFDDLTNNNFMPLITIPTRITAKTKTLIDNILYNHFSPGIKSGNLNVSISDHVPQFAIIPLSNKHPTHVKQDVFARNFKDINQPILLNTLKAEILKSNKENSNLDEDLSNLLESTDRTVDQLFPLKKISKRQLKRKIKPWITSDILNAIKLRDKIYTKLKNSTDDSRKENLKIELRDKKSNVKNMLRASKKNYFTKYFTDNSKNAKKLWEGINEIIANKPKIHNTIKCLETKDNNGNTINITDPKEIPKIANIYYTNIADKILKKQKYSGNKHFASYLKNPNQNVFTPNPSTPTEIESIIKEFDSSKSVGPNSLPPKLLKHIAPIVSNPISDICNKSFLQGTFPKILKLSKINPIHKKDSRLDISNYRPISLLSNINKIIEKLMFNRLYTFLEDHKCIYNLQFGFRKNHSTNHAILSIIDKIKDAIKNNNFAIGIFIDLQKAFDTVNHSILLKKLWD